MDRDKLGDMILLPPHKPFTHLLVIHPIRTDWAPSGAVLEVPWPLVSPVGRGGGDTQSPSCGPNTNRGKGNMWSQAKTSRGWVGSQASELVTWPARLQRMGK